jgi:D-amino-acid dehydrogenase
VQRQKDGFVKQRFDTVVIGGGIVGWSAAHRLAAGGQRVAVVDRGDPGQATAAGAGIISPGTSIRLPRPALPLSRAAVAYYPELVAQLRDEGELETGFASPGTLFVFQTAAELDRLPEVKTFAEQLKAEGFGSIGEISTLSGAEARQVFPALGDLPGALHLSGGSRVDGRLIRDALRGAALRRGAVEFTGDAAPRRETDRVAGITVGDEVIGADAVLIAGGAWTKAVGATLGVALPVAPQRGQILHLELPDVETSGWPIIHGFHNHYLLTFPTHRVVAGATREDGSGFDYRMTAGGVHQELGEALRVAPGLAQATLAEVRIGFRPSSVDALPILGRFPQFANAYVATGHGPSGLQLGPVSGAAVADLILGATPMLAIDAYSPARFH